ncbi:glycosyltransferase [Microbacterium paludicola]|uniref:Glycosyltransferase n=1 Tax=Microbacterium paludicola TaxID=300019 RepID=A0A4Y9FV83_9MICO|nr:glycosyltransferase [Microbacterium paludicola]MBF0816857.1 glycosyltransferase [Microbacterium paludicola]TFU32450.1 glycosyltransferase [Microbacterium paludicola]
MPDPGRFARTGRAEIAAIVVTYGSPAHLETLLAGLREEARDVALRVIVADNSPDDTTLRVARAHPDVLAVATGGNLGYAGGINCALEHIGDSEAVLILNPDLRVHAGALRTMLGRLRGDPRRGAVVPRIVDEHRAACSSSPTSGASSARRHTGSDVSDARVCACSARASLSSDSRSANAGADAASAAAASSVVSKRSAAARRASTSPTASVPRTPSQTTQSTMSAARPTATRPTIRRHDFDGGPPAAGVLPVVSRRFTFGVAVERWRTRVRP